MYITTDQHTKLAQKLFDKMIALKRDGETNIKMYEITFQEVIEKVFPNKPWWEVTDCQIFQHLLEYRNPQATVIAILKGLKED